MSQETPPESRETAPIEASVENPSEIDEASMDIVESDTESTRGDVVDAPEKVSIDNSESREKSRVQKEAFLEMFRIAPRIRDILPDLRNFVAHPDVVDADRDEINQLVQLRIADEKARKKAEKEREREKELTERPAVDLAQAIRSATGLLLNRIPQKPTIPTVLQALEPVLVPETSIPAETAIPAVVPIPVALPSTAEPAAPLVLGGPIPKVMGHGKAGFGTPHPKEAPSELTSVIPELIATVPEELRVIVNHLKKKPEIPPIPNELLPLNQRAPEPIPVSVVRPSIRKTLLLAGARPGKRQDRIEEELKRQKEEKRKKKRAESDRKNPIGVINRSLPPGVAPIPKFSLALEKKKARGYGARKPRGYVLPAGLNRNSPMAVKRYHARQLAKEDGISLEEAFAEIEAIAELAGHPSTPFNEPPPRGGRGRDYRHDYMPADHSKGIPGVDRPPAYGPPFPGERGRRGGKKEQAKRKRREEEARRNAFGGGGGGPAKYGRYEEEHYRPGYDQYPPKNAYRQEQYGGYDGYFDGPERGYEQFDRRYHHYEGQQQQQQQQHYDERSGGGYEENYDYYGHEGHQASSYHQEDGSQYYNDYYGVNDDPMSSDADATTTTSSAHYHATFDTTSSGAPSDGAPWQH